MFYETSAIDKALRFGDILQGFVTCTPKINDLISSSSLYKYQIEVSGRPFFAVLSPCCSISDKVISLNPLIELRGSFFNNPHFVEDLTRINSQVEPEKSLPPQAWEHMDPDEKARRLSSPPGYVFLECFVYEKHDLFPPYIISRKEGDISTNYYMIDFRFTFRVDCDKIINPKQAPLESKVLQLSVETRAELRDKISRYFSRIPDEDLISA